MNRVDFLSSGWGTCSGDQEDHDNQTMKWKERVALTLAAAAVLLTCILVLDVRFQQTLAEEDAQAVRHGVSRNQNGRKFQKQFLDNNATSGGQAQVDGDLEPDEQPGAKQATNNEEDQAAQQARYTAFFVYMPKKWMGWFIFIIWLQWNLRQEVCNWIKDFFSIVILNGRSSLMP